MKALVYRGEPRLRLEDVPEPVPGEGEVLLHVAAVGVCGSDLGMVHGGQPQIPVPLVPGHEFGGHLDNGDFVVVNPIVSCGNCPLCLGGLTHLCSKRMLIGFRRQGAYAERIAVPRANIIPAPGLTPAQAALAEPVANGIHAWNRLGRPAQSVAIIGAGSVGLSLLHVLKSHGVRDITVVDPQDARLQHARSMGAGHTGAALQDSFDAVFDAAGTQQTRVSAVAATRPGGSVGLIGLHDDTLSISAAALIVGDKTVCGCFAYTAGEFREAVAMVASMDTGWTLSQPFGEAEAVYEALLAGRAATPHAKTIFEFAH